MNYYLVLLFLLNIVHIKCNEIRGVSLSMAPLYTSSLTSFSCLDGSKTIPRDQVNDDYCDCPDSSDEPGTSACPNGSFHCANVGYKPVNIPSTRVNDGLCDCCDGSDEYESSSCPNLCDELGRAAREEEEKRRQLLEMGSTIRNDYISQGKTAVEEKKKRLQELEKLKTELETVKNDLENVKKVAEEPEKAAVDAHKQKWEEEKKALEKEKSDAEAWIAFEELDTDRDGKVSITEFQVHKEFDSDQNGEVSVEEAKEFLEGNDMVDLDQFRDNIWKNIKYSYKSVKEEEQKPDENHDEAPAESEEGEKKDEDDEYKYDYDEEEEEDIPKVDKKPRRRPPKPKEEKKEEEDFPLPDYNEETKQLIAAADEARNKFNEAETKFNDVEREYKDIQQFLELDLGPELEFYAIKDQCFEYKDREYVYKLCPFNQVTQASKDGGHETSLGTWARWSGQTEDYGKYFEMKFEGGEHCWNGPARSATIQVRCGAENKLLSAEEPNRCEYAMNFETPAVCKSEKQGHKHEEL